MAAQSLNNLTSLGAGVLGGQIAWHSAFYGKNVVVYDLYNDSIDACKIAHQTYADIYKKEMGGTDESIAQTHARLSYTTDLAAAVADADIVIESVPEVPEIKSDFYKRLAKVLPEHTIIATNSSTLLPSQFAQDTGRPEKYCALHFANLIWKMNLAETMSHPTTSYETLLATAQFAVEIGMIPIPIQKEQNGYVCNTMTVTLLNAAQTLVTNGISTPEYIDRVHMIIHRGCAAGPCALIDVVGMATWHNVLTHWGKELKDDQMTANAAYIKEHFLDKGLQGLQGGEGYYKYPNPSFAAPDFIDVPDVSIAEEIARLSMPS